MITSCSCHRCVLSFCSHLYMCATHRLPLTGRRSSVIFVYMCIKLHPVHFIDVFCRLWFTSLHPCDATHRPPLTGRTSSVTLARACCVRQRWMYLNGAMLSPPRPWLISQLASALTRRRLRAVTRPLHNTLNSALIRSIWHSGRPRRWMHTCVQMTSRRSSTPVVR